MSYGKAYLLAHSQERNTVLAALSVGFGIWVLGLVLALAVKSNRQHLLALGPEVESADLQADLGGKLHELERLCRLEEDNLMAFILLSLRDEILNNIRNGQRIWLLEVETYGVDKSERRGAIELQRMGVVRLDLLGFGDLALEGDINGKGGVLVASKLGDLDGRRLGLLGRLGLRSLLLNVLPLRSLLGDLGRSGGSSLAFSLGLLR